ncbi:MAG: carboxymuconolactone decarboxylase family protein [Thiolinea sp.]
MSINYAEVNSRALNLLLAVKKHVPAIDRQLKALVELRVSQINGCAYCIDLHASEAREFGEQQQRLDCLVVWRESGLFSEREMAALQWAESVTNIAVEADIETKLEALLSHFNETEVVDLTWIVALMNCLNRMAISFADKPVIRNG